MLCRRIKTIAMDVFKSLHDLNPNFMKEMLRDSLRDSNIIYQPKFEKVTYCKNTFKYYDAHIWIFLPNEIKETADILSLKSLIMTWKGPKCQCNMCNINQDESDSEGKDLPGDILPYDDQPRCTYYSGHSSIYETVETKLYVCNKCTTKKDA